MPETALSPSSLCQQCNGEPRKYRCPKCFMQTCSVSCIQTHKEATGCNGVRDRVGFVAIKEFSDQLLLNDLSFLEEVSQLRGRSNRDNLVTNGHGQKRPSFIKKLQDGCRQPSRMIDLKIMAPGMTKRKMNRSIYDQQKSEVLWTVEIIFGWDGERILRHRVKERSTLEDVVLASIGKDQVRQHRLGRYIDDDSAVFMIAPHASSSPYRRVDRNSTLADAIRSSTVIEYPTIHVARGSEISQFTVTDRLLCVDEVHQGPESSQGSDGGRDSTDQTGSECREHDVIDSDMDNFTIPRLECDPLTR
uniref:Box C/D snoRNA protein 1 n=1 Tax=Spongospora subterranea TaxID=70186 RepID=A0A0H5RCU5_9EUKA|eukprot:CRZ11422.1 hypothetical protein [Spongospora subterranea]